MTKFPIQLTNYRIRCGDQTFEARSPTLQAAIAPFTLSQMAIDEIWLLNTRGRWLLIPQSHLKCRPLKKVGGSH